MILLLFMWKKKRGERKFLDRTNELFCFNKLLEKRWLWRVNSQEASSLPYTYLDLKFLVLSKKFSRTIFRLHDLRSSHHLGWPPRWLTIHLNNFFPAIVRLIFCLDKILLIDVCFYKCCSPHTKISFHFFYFDLLLIISCRMHGILLWGNICMRILILEWVAAKICMKEK